jgi:hypothetical protein
VSNLPGDPGGDLLPGTSWDVAAVEVAGDGTLTVASTRSTGSRGLSGLQIVPEPGSLPGIALGALLLAGLRRRSCADRRKGAIGG